MTRRHLVLFAVLLGSLLLFPIGLVVWNEVKLATGTEVLLDVRPVDPEDPFQGQYVALTYSISQMRPPPGTEIGDTVYVVLTRGEPALGIVTTSTRPPSGRFIRGRVASFPPIEFGIESFFVEEGQGPRYEDAIREGRVLAKVVLDDDGGARLKDLVVR